MDTKTRALMEAMEETFPRAEGDADAAEIRRLAKAASAPRGEPEVVARVENRSIPGPAEEIPVRIYRPSDEEGLPCLVFFHGGGWVICDLDSHDGLCRAITTSVGCVVVSVDYRLAPEHKFPAAAEDAYAATAWTVEHANDLGVDPRRVAVGGDSAGGNLTAVVALMARDRGGPALAAQMMVYPATDHDGEWPSRRDNAEGYFLTAAAMRWYWDQYLARPEDADDPYASPMRAPDLSGLPPALVVTAEYDPLRDEGEAYGERLRDAGVPVTVTRYDGMFHGFFSLGELLDDARRANGETFAELRRALRR